VWVTILPSKMGERKKRDLYLKFPKPQICSSAVSKKAGEKKRKEGLLWGRGGGMVCVKTDH